MAKIRHITDGQDRGVPRNWQDLSITFNWLENKEEGAISSNEMEFVLDQFRYINERLLSGLSGGVGIFEGIPYDIEVGETGNPVFVFKGYIDGSAKTTFIGQEEIKATIKKAEGDDWLADVADSFSFGYLYSIGEITNSDFVKVPYCINYVPDAVQMGILQLSLFMMAKEVIENIRTISDLVAEAVNAGTPVLGTSVGAGAGVVTAWDLGDWIGYAAKILANLIYTIALNIAIKNLIEELINQIFPPMRYHLGMYVKDLFRIGAAHLGLGFSSQLLNGAFMSDVVYIPTKDRKGGASGERGFPNANDPIYGFGDLIRTWQTILNAEYKIIDGVFHFERKDAWQQTSGFTIPAVYTNQARMLNVLEPNTDEFIANTNIHYELDRQDQNTLDDITGYTFQAVIKPNTVINQKLVTMKGLKEISIPFALGKRKDGLTDLEKFAKSVLGVVDSLTGIFGGGTNYANQIESRIGAMLLSSHFIGVGKVVKFRGGKLLPNQREVMGAKNYWNLFHYIDSFAEVNGVHNQWLSSPPYDIAISESDVALLMGNPFCITADGKRAMIEQMVWKPSQDKATITPRINEKYTNNLRVEYVE